MLYQVITNTESKFIDYDQEIGRILSWSVTELVKQSRDNFAHWQEIGYYLENYLNDQTMELLSVLISELNDLSPVGKYNLLLICIQKKPEAWKAEQAQKIAPLQPNIDWPAVTKRAALILKAMHRNALLTTVQTSDRLLEEQKIVRRKFKLNSPIARDFHFTHAAMVYDSLRLLLRTIEHQLYVDMVGTPDIQTSPEDLNTVIKSFDEIVDGAIAFLNQEGIFIPIVIKTIQEQRDPYQLITFVEDLFILFSLIKKADTPDLKEMMIRDEIAKVARKRDLDERYVNWLINYEEYKIGEEQLNKPLAKKIAQALKSGVLGTGKLYTALQSRLAKASAPVAAQIKYLVLEVINRSEVTIAKRPLSLWLGDFRWSETAPNTIDLKQTLVDLKGRSTPEEWNRIGDHDRLQIKELAQILELLRAR